MSIYWWRLPYERDQRFEVEPSTSGHGISISELRTQLGCYETTLPDSIFDRGYSDGNSVLAGCFDRYGYRVVV